MDKNIIPCPLSKTQYENHTKDSEADVAGTTVVFA